MNKRIEAGLSSLAVCIAVASAPGLWAEETTESAIDERTVGAPNTEALSSTSFDFAELELRGVHGLTDMVGSDSAGLILEPSTFNSAAFELSLRGMTGTDTHTITGEPGVGVFIDGAYIGRSQGLSMDLLDIEEVTIARGAQGVLAGRNTLGGAVYLNSSKPTGEFGFEQKVQFGEVGDESTAITHLNLPQFAEMISTKISYLVHRHDGYVDNVAGNSSDSRENFSVRDNEGFRVAFSVATGGPITFDYSILDATIDSTAGFYQDLSIDNTFDDTGDVSGLAESSVDITHHTQSLAIQGERGLLTAVVSYRDVESRENAGFEGVLGQGVEDFYDRPSRLEQQQFTQKIQFDTSLNDSVDLTLGLENFNEQADSDENGYAGQSDVDVFSVFAQANLSVSDTMSLVLGWRETSEDKTIRSIFHEGQPGDQGARVDLDDDLTSISAAVKVAISDTATAYLSYSTAYKSGGASLYSDSLANGTGAFFTPYDAEELESIEAGVDTILFEGALELGISVFSNDIDDKQITVSNADNLRLTDVVNLDETTTVEGVEVDFSAELFSGFVFSGNYTYLDGETAEVVDPFNTANTIEVYAAGVAEHTAAAAIDWTLGDYEEGAFKLHLDYSGLGSYVFNSTNGNAASRDVLNARVSASGFQLEGDEGQIEIGIWVQNLLDNEYLINSVVVNRGAAGQYEAGTFGEPRSYGIDFRYNL